MDVSVRMEIKTCGSCGTLYCIPNWVGFARCPMCAGRKIAELVEEVSALRRTVSALRGAVARASRRTP